MVRPLFTSLGSWFPSTFVRSRSWAPSEAIPQGMPFRCFHPLAYPAKHGPLSTSLQGFGHEFSSQPVYSTRPFCSSTSSSPESSASTKTGLNGAAQRATAGSQHGVTPSNTSAGLAETRIPEPHPRTLSKPCSPGDPTSAAPPPLPPAPAARPAGQSWLSRWLPSSLAQLSWKPGLPPPAVALVDRGASTLYNRTNASVADLSVKLNQLTGYIEIEQLKAKVDQADDGLTAAREELRRSRERFEAKTAEHEDVQRQQMALMERKSSWTVQDVDEFSRLFRREHALRGEVADAKTAYGAAAEALEGAHAALLRAIRERYSVETLWSDKIRRASTWWTAGLMALNLVSFLTVYLWVEPIKARRIQNHVADVFRDELAHVRRAVTSLQDTVESVQAGPVSASQLTGQLPPQPSGAGAGAVAGGAGQEVSGGEGGLPWGARELLTEVRQVQRGLAAVEKRVAEVGGGLAAQGAALRSLSAALAPQPDGAAREQPSGQERRVGSEEAAGGTGMEDGEVGRVEGRGVAGWAGMKARVVEWGEWAGKQLRQVVSVPEVRTGAAAFVGAVVGAGLLLVLRDQR